MDDTKKLNIENGHLIFKNFAGEEKQYNPVGRRNFCVVIDPEIVDELRATGWNIKMLPSRDEEEEPVFYLQVRVSYDKIPPRIYMVTKRKKTLMSEEALRVFDSAQILNADMVIRPYVWDKENHKITAYIETMYITIEEDRFASKYDMYDIADE